MNRSLLAAALGCLALAACTQSGEEAAAPAAPLTLHEVMKDQVDANADALWELTNPLLDDTASFDPARMDDAIWARITELSGKVEQGSRTLAAMDPIVVAAEGVTLSDQAVEFGHTPARVQAFVDADPATFRELATTLADHMGELSAAAAARDPQTAARLVDELEGVCESCHLKYWYPEAQQLIDSAAAANAAAADQPAE